MSLPLWREHLVNALHENAGKRHCQYMQLATCNNVGIPHCRTLVFRGFDENSDTLIMHTDLRSEKITHIRENNRTEICWYFSETREQFRLAGTIEIVTSEKHTLGEVRRQHWQKLSNEGRASYYQAVPGITLSEPQKNNDKQITTEENHSSPANTFALLMFKPSSVDHLLLEPAPQKRTVHHLNAYNDWFSERINP